MDIDLTGRTAIVTGAGRGIGAEIATAFAETGADVAVAARTESEIEQTADRVRDHGVDAAAIPTDLREPADIHRLVDETNEVLGRPDVLVNNAAANLAGAPLTQDVEEITTMLEVNLRGLYLLTQRVTRDLVEADAGWGRVVNVGSIVSNLGVPAMTVYSGTKAGVAGVTRGLTAELAPQGITVNTVSPGMTRVDRIERLMEEKGEIYDIDRIPARRLGDPADITAACAFLASDHASYITGVELPVDGGVTITAGLYR